MPEGSHPQQQTAFGAGLEIERLRFVEGWNAVYQEYDERNVCLDAGSSNLLFARTDAGRDNEGASFSLIQEILLQAVYLLLIEVARALQASHLVMG